MTKPTVEQRLSRALRTMFDSAEGRTDLVEAPNLRDVFAGLEYFLPGILAEVYPHWKREWIDGFYLAEARKIGSLKVEMRGVCILISDQAITPFHLKMKVASSGDSIAWMECSLGKRGEGKGGMERISWSTWHVHPDRYLQDSLMSIDWAYQVTFGEADESHTELVEGFVSVDRSRA